MGYYVPVGNNAVFEVLGVTVPEGRRVPQHPVRIAGGGAHARAVGIGEDLRARERVLPGIVDVTCQPFVLHSVVKIKQQYEGHARQVLLAVMGAEPTWAKMVTVVDEDVDIYNMDDVMWAILTRSRPDKDFITIPDTPTFYRDPNRDHWGRMGIDATAPFARRDEFVRKRIPGADAVDISQYIEPENEAKDAATHRGAHRGVRRHLRRAGPRNPPLAAGDRDARHHFALGAADARGRNRPCARLCPRSRAHRSQFPRYRGRHRLGLVPDARHADRAVLGQDARAESPPATATS